jgi:hypothetical protein
MCRKATNSHRLDGAPALKLKLQAVQIMHLLLAAGALQLAMAAKPQYPPEQRGKQPNEPPT